jgi:cation:H+ antiporter
LAVIIVASLVLSWGAEGLAHRFGARFVGRTVLSVTTTLPEIVLVASAATLGFYGTALGSALGSNVLMMSLGLALMVLIATTRLSKQPARWVGVQGFRLDAIFLAATAVASAALFWDGYGLLDGIIFLAFFALYTVFAAYETRKPEHRVELHGNSAPATAAPSPTPSTWSPRRAARYIAFFVVGAAGVFWAAGPFVHALEDLALALALPSMVVAVILSPVAGEMPEKLSVMLLARQGTMGVDIAIANVLGSKILNNSLLLGIMMLSVVAARGWDAIVPAEALFTLQVYWTAVITFLALFLLVDKRLTRREGGFLLAIYGVSMVFQFLLPGLTRG